MTLTAPAYRVLNVAPNTPEWLRARKGGIGASEAAAVLGHSRWGSRASIWLEKRSPEVRDLGDSRMMWGHRMEPRIGEWSQEDYPEFGSHLPGEGLIQSIPYPHLMATLDFRVMFPEGDAGPLEIKNVDKDERYRWVDNLGNWRVPSYYWIQVQQQMTVMGAWRGLVQPFIGGNELPAPIRVFRDDKFVEEQLIGRLGDFWTFNVVGGVRPDPVLGDDLTALWAGEQGKPVVANQQAIDTAGLAYVTGRDRVAIEKYEKGLKFALGVFMEDATELVHPETGKTIHTYRPNKNGVRTHRAVTKELMSA